MKLSTKQNTQDTQTGNHPDTYLNNYTKERLEEMGVSREENLIEERVGGEEWNLYHFAPKEKGSPNLEILYLDWEGKPMYYRGRGKWQQKQKYTRTRLRNPLVSPEGKVAKYLSPKNTEVRPYLNGLWQYYKTQGTTPLNHLVITEGEFKAFKACKEGIPTIGISGIHNGVKTIRDDYGNVLRTELLPELQQLIRELDIRKITYLHDGDCLKNQYNKKRAVSFYTSVRNMEAACHRAGVGFVYKHIQPHQPKGLDDLLSAYPDRISAIRNAVTDTRDNPYFKSMAGKSMEHIARHFGVSAPQQYIPRAAKQEKRQKITLANGHSVISGQFDKGDVTHTIQQYISEKQALIEKKIKIHQRLALTSDTGTAKTDTLYRIFEAQQQLPPGHRQFERMIVVFPKNSDLAAKTEEYSKAANNYHQLEFPILDINQYTDAEIYQYLGLALDAHPVIHVTQASFQKLIPYLRDTDLIVADEVHKVVLDNFEQTRNFWSQLMEVPGHTVMLTGTPFRELYEEFYITEMTFVCRQQKKFRTRVRNITYTDEQGQKQEFVHQKLVARVCAEAVIPSLKNINPQPGMTYIVFLNHKKHIDLLAQKLREDYDYRVQVIYSDDRVRQGRDYRRLIQEKKLASDPQRPTIVFCTSFVYECISIYNTNISDIIVIGEEWPENVQQAMARFRNIYRGDQPPTIHYLLARRKEESTPAGPQDPQPQDQPPQEEEEERSYVSRYPFESYAKQHTGGYWKSRRKLTEIGGTVLGPDHPEEPQGRVKGAPQVSRFTREDGSHDRLDMIKGYYRLRTRRMPNIEKFEAVDPHCLLIQDLVVTLDKEWTKALSEQKKREKDIEKQCVQWLIQAAPYMAVWLLEHRIPTPLKQQLKKHFPRHRKLKKEEEYQQWKAQLKPCHLAPMTSLTGRWAYLRHYFEDSANLWIMVSENNSDHRFQNLLQAIAVLTFRKNPDQKVPGLKRKLDGHYLQKITALDSIQDVALSRKEIEALVEDLYEGFPLIDLYGTRATRLFLTLFEATETRVRSPGDTLRFFRDNNFPRRIQTLECSLTSPLKETEENREGNSPKKRGRKPKKKEDKREKGRFYHIRGLRTLEQWAGNEGLKVVSGYRDCDPDQDFFNGETIEKKNKEKQTSQQATQKHPDGILMDVARENILSETSLKGEQVISVSKPFISTPLLLNENDTEKEIPDKSGSPQVFLDDEEDLDFLIYQEDCPF